ncbi:MAG: DUF6923 family protein [Usitatibacter sp.]
MKRQAFRLLACIALISGAAGAETLYVASLRDYGNQDAAGVGGILYSVDVTNGATKMIAPLRIGGVIPIGLTGLSIHPKTGVHYGITAGLSPNLPRSLVTVDPSTGNATLVGSLGQSGSDIRFDPQGTLYIWLTDPPRLGTVNLGTGAATALGDSGYVDALGGAIAFDHKGTMYVSATTAGGTLDKLDPATGRATTGPRLNGAPFLSAIHSMSFSASGELYAVNSNLGAPAKAQLVKIDPATGNVTPVGALPNDSDPLSFLPPIQSARTTSLERQWLYVALAFLLGAGLGWALGRFKGSRPKSGGPAA